MAYDDRIRRQLREHIAGAAPPPPAGSHGERFLYGLAQPLLGARLLLQDPVVLRAAVTPVAWLALFCAVVALVDADGGPFVWGFLRRFYALITVLAPVPSVLLANHYSRLAAIAHTRLGFGPCEPRREKLGRRATHALRQLVLVAIGAAPVVAVAELLPFVGLSLGAAVAAVWALHWIVVEAFDSARIVHAQVASAARPEDLHATPWFVRGLQVAAQVPIVAWAARPFARLLARLSRPWREEIALLERTPVLGAGFSLTTAVLLALPILNLLFRPIVIIASVHLLAHLGPAADAETQAAHEVAATAAGPSA